MSVFASTSFTRRAARRRLAVLCGVSIPALLFGVNTAGAQTAAQTDQLTEIVVTAQRRNESLQSVPVAVTALPAEALARASVVSTQDLRLLTPGLNFSKVGKFGQPRIRGIGTTADTPTMENPVATYVDGVYYANQGASVLALNSVEQIEVDKGPQGTLFGRNATGGLIQIKTRDPSLAGAEGQASVAYENYNTITGSAYVGGPVANNLAADLAVYGRRQADGYGVNVLTGQEINKMSTYVARSKWIYTPTADTKVVFIADYLDTSGAAGQSPAPGTTPLGGAPSLSGQDIAVPAAYDNSFKQAGVSLRVEQQVGDLMLMSTSAYRKGKGTDFFPNVGQSPASLTQVQLYDFSESASQELQLQSPSGAPLEWTTGVFLFYGDGGWDPIDLNGGALAPLRHIYMVTDQKTYSGAIYGQATYKIQDATRLTVGLRYTEDHRAWHIGQTFDAPFLIPAVKDAGKETFKKLTWRFALDHKFDDGTLVYASANRGFKSGGFNDFLVPATPYQPEQLDAYEVGLKSQLFDRRLRLNLAGFYYDYKNVQVNRYESGVLLIYNGASARVYGLEVEGDARLTSNFSMNFGLSVLNDKYTSFPNADITTPAPGGGTNISTGSAKGNRLSHTPDWTLSLAGNYEVPLPTGSLELNANYFHSDGFTGSVDERLRQPAYDVVGAQISWVSDDTLLKVSAFGRNLTNEAYADTLYAQANGDIIQYAPPRTYGVKIERKF